MNSLPQGRIVFVLGALLSFMVPMILILLFLSVTASAQMIGKDPRTLALSGSYFRRVVVPDHMTLVLSTPDIQIDTLIMDRKSVIKLEQYSTRLTVGYAVIGKKCLIDGRGDLGFGVGVRGTDGKSMSLTINFQKLGRLTINTSGGQGSVGPRGSPAAPGQSGATGIAEGGRGGPGGAGGRGGDAGNFSVHYRCIGFTPVFAKAKKNSIILKYHGGSGGGGGPGGFGGPGAQPTGRSYVGPDGKTINETKDVQRARGANGTAGPLGDNGKDGVLVVEEIH